MDNKPFSKKPFTKFRNSLDMPAGMGKIPPQAVDLEEAVLGALLLEKSAINEVINILSPESFYKEAHERIFRAIITLFTKSEPIDILTVANCLRTTGELEIVGGPFYITELTSRISSAANVDYHARIIAEKHIKRQMIILCSDTLKNCYDETVDSLNLIDDTQESIFKISNSINNGSESKEMKTVVRTVMENMVKAMQLPDGITGIPSGFTDIDKLTGGWQKSDLIIIAARPSMGKTAYLVNNVRNTAIKFGLPVAMFSLEMSAEQLVSRMIASECDEIEISTSKMVRGRITEEELSYISKKINLLAASNIFIDDAASLSINQLKSKCHRLKIKHDIQLIVVDYLQLMSGSGKSGKGIREQEISEITRGLKNIAKSLNVPVIALSQLSREVEKRTDKRPMLSDLRESGAIEQDADVVAFLYRPEYYKIDEDENGNSLKGIGEFIIQKHRNGPLDTILLRYISRQTKFKDMYDEPTTAFNFGSSSTFFDEESEPF